MKNDTDSSRCGALAGFDNLREVSKCMDFLSSDGHFSQQLQHHQEFELHVELDKATASGSPQAEESM